MAVESGDLDIVHADEVSPEDRRKAAIVVCRHANNRADAEQLLDMLGLRGEPKRGCRHCGGPLPIIALAPNAGFRGCCSTACKRAAFGQGAQR